MKSSAFGTGRYPAATYLGLLWVYGAAGCLLAAFAAGGLEWTGGVIAVMVRMAATVAVGVGLCAAERWAWGPAVALSGLYSLAAAGLASRATWILVAPPAGTLSWMPVFWGLNLAGCARVAFVGWIAAAIAGANLWLLWRAQGHFDIPYRRPYSVMLRFGLAPTLLIIALDTYLLRGWWSVWTG